MASAFDNLATTIQMANLRWPDGRKGQWLLWPVWVRRVAAPSRPSTRLGPFERAVLGCARARIADAEHIGSLLNIDRKLVKIIQQSLVQQGTLDESAGITTEGMDALDAGETEATSINVVHVLQCGITGLLMPRVADQLQYADVTRGEDGLRIETGSVADSRQQRCVTVRPPHPDEPAVPEANDVLAAIRRHFGDLRSASSGRADAHDAVADGYRSRPTALKRVNIIDVRATPMFLATVAYSTALEESDEGDDWRIMDPFGLGESRRLLDTADRLRASDKEFDQQIRRLTRKQTSQSTSADTVDPSLVWQMAQDQVATKLGTSFRTWRGHDHLVSMEDALLWYGESKFTAQKNRNLRRSAQAARDAIEACFASLASAFPLSPLLGRIRTLNNTPADEAFLKDKLVIAAQACGLTGSLPRRFAVRPRDMRAVLEAGHFSKLGAVVMSTVLLAAERADHPLREAAQVRPTLMDELDRAFMIAGEAAHDSGGAAPDQGDVEFLIATVYWMIETLLAGVAASAPVATRRQA